jgi:hypothetical protein
MQLKVRRGQTKGGMFGGKQLFTADVRAEYTPDEKENINRYNLGGEVLYSSRAAQERLATAGAHFESGGMGLLKGLGSVALSKMNLTITIKSLQDGHHIECQDLGELLECEEAIIESCKGLRGYLAAAATFDGREILVNVDEL